MPTTPHIEKHFTATATVRDIVIGTSDGLAVTLLALLVFGHVRARFTGINPLRGAFQTVLIGGLTAAAAFAIARLIG
jgi:VIT1/CCC1 family predicted Fe2+/Mn2+ transporter